MKKIKILLVGAGRRYSLVEKLKQSDFEVYCYELDEKVPVSKNSKIIKGLKFTDTNIKKDILDKINHYGIQISVPLMDQAIPILSELKKENPNLNFLCPDFFSSEICFDKKKFEIWCKENVSEFYPTDNRYPKICKPRFGFSSKEISIIEDERGENGIDKDNFVLQKKLNGKEYSVDVYFDKKGNFIDAVTRERLRTAGGEVISSITEYNESIYEATKKIGVELNLKGPACFQFMLDDQKNPKIIEINSRMGGGCLLSIESGLDIINLIKNDYFGYDFYYEPKKWKNGLLMERYFSETFFIKTV